MHESIKLTQFSHGAGCGCKISPKILDQILQTNHKTLPHEKLLVGNESKDDAAVYDLGNGEAVISTTDFFMPIVDDPFDFGRIASANAISDVYAMGGVPLMAIAILGWPINTLSPDIAQQVLEGSRAICAEAGIPLAGGHSIDAPEPIFGLAVTGKVAINQLKQNNTAQAGDLLYLTKPLGIGILTTAEKKGILEDAHKNLAAEQMVKLNRFGSAVANLHYVHAMTDVTGFGLLGHLSEMCEGSALKAEVYFEAVPKIDEATNYIAAGAIPGGTNRNWDSYGHKIEIGNDVHKHFLADPQTSGGLLLAVKADMAPDFELIAKAKGMQLKPLGKLGHFESKYLIKVQ